MVERPDWTKASYAPRKHGRRYRRSAPVLVVEPSLGATCADWSAWLCIADGGLLWVLACEKVADVYARKGAKVSDLDEATVEKWRAIARGTAWKDYAAKTPLSAELLKLAEGVNVS